MLLQFTQLLLGGYTVHETLRQNNKISLSLLSHFKTRHIFCICLDYAVVLHFHQVQFIFTLYILYSLWFCIVHVNDLHVSVHVLEIIIVLVVHVPGFFSSAPFRNYPKAIPVVLYMYMAFFFTMY